MFLELRNKQFKLNPLTTDLHIGCLSKTLVDNDNFTAESWAFMALLLSFMFPDADFVSYDPNTKHGEILLTTTELINILSFLQQTQVKDDKAERIAELQKQIEELTNG